METQKILLIVDAQECFISGVLGSEYAKSIVPYIVKKAGEKRKEGYKAVVTYDTHDKNYLSTREGRLLPIPHGNPEDEKTGWALESRIMDAVRKYENLVTVQKGDFGTFDIPSAVKVLFGEEAAKGNGSGMEIFCMGFDTDVCVISILLILRFQYPEARIICDSKGCAGITREKHEAALEVMRSCQIEVI